MTVDYKPGVKEQITVHLQQINISGAISLEYCLYTCISLFLCQKAQIQYKQEVRVGFNGTMNTQSATACSGHHVSFFQIARPPICSDRDTIKCSTMNETVKDQDIAT